MDIERLPNRDLASGNQGSHGPAVDRKWLRLAVTTGLTITVGIFAALLIYSNSSASAWQATAQEKAAALAAMTGERDAGVTELGHVKAELEATTEKYNESAARIRSLADEKAQVGDFAAQLTELTVLSQNVTTELDACVDQLQQLQGYLINFDNYDPDAMVAVLEEVNDGCNSAQDDNAALAKLIADL